MSKTNSGDIIPSSGFVSELVLRIKLIWRLLMDKRVNFFLKLLPAFSVLYLINPIDLPTPLDDAAIVGLGFTLFVSLCPHDIVQEHMAALRKGLPANTEKPANADIIEGKFESVPDEDNNPSEPSI